MAAGQGDRRLAHEGRTGGHPRTAEDVWTECGRCCRVAPHAVVWKKNVQRYVTRGMCRDCKRDDDLRRKGRSCGVFPERPPPPPVPVVDDDDSDAAEDHIESADTPPQGQKNLSVGEDSETRENVRAPGDGGKAKRRQQAREWQAFNAARNIGRVARGRKKGSKGNGKGKWRREG